MELVFATHNQHKVKEIKALLPNSFKLLSLSDIGCHEEILETADTIRGNALLKASYVKKQYGLDCFADDSGLEVEALNGAPGVYSARYAGPEKKDTANVAKLLKEMEQLPNRKAQFVTTIALAIGVQQKTFTGVCKGKILIAQQGTNGFGYDPVFNPDGYTCSFAEMTQTEKSKISHRGKALQKLLAYLASCTLA